MNQTRPDDPQFDDILNRSVDALRRREKTLSQILREHPRYAKELKRLLAINLLLGDLQQDYLKPKQIDRISKKLGSTRRRPSQRSGLLLGGGLARLAAGFLIVTALTVGSGATLVAASNGSRPGDTLYPVKKLWEAILLLFSPLTGSKSDLYLQYARLRLGEVEALYNEGRLTEDALLELYKAFYGAINSNTQHVPELKAYLDSAHQTLLTMPPTQENLKLIYDDLLRACTLVVVNNEAMPLPSETPPSVINAANGQPAQLTPTVAVETPLPTLTSTAVPSETLLPTQTAVLPTETSTLTATFTPSPTSRIPATATKTVTPSPTLTPSITPTPTATATLTPLPLPGNNVPYTSPVPTLPPGIIASSTPVILTEVGTPRQRETQQSVYMTQTAQAGGP